MLLGMCLPNSCSAVLTSPELMKLIKKSMEKERDESKARWQQKKDKFKKNKEAADKAFADARAACEKSCDASGLTIPTEFGEWPISCDGFSPPCNVNAEIMEMYKGEYMDCSKVNEWNKCPRRRCKWDKEASACVAQENKEAKDAAEEEKFLSKCSDGKCSLPIKCGADADQKFLDDVGKKTRRSIRTAMKIKGVNYDKLVANPTLRAKFEKATKRAVARKCGNGVTEENVVLDLSPGSVNVDATIVTPDDSDADAIMKTVQSSTKEISEEVVKDVKAVDGISEVEEGSVSADAADAPETDDSTAIEPVSPTGDKLVDPGQEGGGSPTDGGNGGKEGGSGSGWGLYVVIALAFLIVAGVGVMFVTRKVSPNNGSVQQGTEMGGFR